MGLKLISAPATTPVSLAEAKAHLRVDFDDDNALIEALIYASTQHVDGPNGFLGRALVDQTWDFVLDAFPGAPHHGWGLRPHGRHHRRDGQIEIPLAPLIEILGVYYLDSTGAEQTFSADNYVVDTYSEPGRIVLTTNASWPTTQDVANAVRIRFRAGYIDMSMSPAVDNVPYPIRAAILLHIGDLYEYRETQVADARRIQPLPWAAEQLLRPHRISLSLA